MSDIEKGAEIALCPFCGDWGAEVAESAVPSIHGGQKQAVYCNTCFCAGPTSETEKGAVEAWNRRVALTPPEGFVLVPVEPTEAMLQEIHLVKSFTGEAMHRRYAAMIAARPEVLGG
jgi:hypothetical protein